MNARPFVEIEAEARNFADQLEQSHNVLIKREIAPLYRIVGELAKAMHAQTAEASTSIRDLSNRVEELERNSVTKPTIAAKWRRLVRNIKAASFIS